MPDTSLTALGLDLDNAAMKPFGHIFAFCLLACACSEPQLVNHAPFAFAGYDGVVTLGRSVLLDASNSYDPDDNSLSYQWTVQTPDGVRQQISDQVVWRFFPDQSGVHVFFLRVSDGELWSSVDIVTFEVLQAQPVAAVVARAGANEIIGAGESVVLSAISSSGPSGSQLSYHWRCVDWPDGAAEGLDFVLEPISGHPEQTRFVHAGGGVSGAFVFELRVATEQLESDPDFVTVGVDGWGQAIRAEASEATRFVVDGDSQTEIDVSAKLSQQADGPVPTTTLVEWWVLAAPEGPTCPVTGQRLSEGLSVVAGSPWTIAYMNFVSECVGRWDILVCPQGAVETCTPTPQGHVALSASCCRGLADRLSFSVEELAP